MTKININDNNIEPEENFTAKNPKEEALLRYINESDQPQNNIPEKAKTSGEAIKEALVGVIGVLYIIFLNPIIGDKTARRKVFMRVIFKLAIFLIVLWMFKNMQPK